MDKIDVIIYVSILLLIMSLSFGFFKTTTFAVNDQKLLVSLDIHPSQQKIKPGQSLLLELVLRVPGGNMDQTSTVNLEYSIKDLDGNVISSKKESGAIAVKESEVTSLLVPTNTKPGVYVAFVDIKYQGNTYEGSKTFEVVNNIYTLNMAVYILIALILLIFVVLIIKKLRDKYYY